MSVANTFSLETHTKNLERLANLNPNTQPLWGKMNAAQALAHINVAYTFGLDENIPKVGGLKGFFFRTFIKKVVVSEKPYGKNGMTSPAFLIADQRDFEVEKTKLIQNLEQIHTKGEKYFDGKENPSFGKLTAKEWSNLFQKHLEHHFSQFGL